MVTQKSKTLAVLGNALIQMHGKNGAKAQCFEVFKDMKERYIVIKNTSSTGLVKN